MSDAPKTKRFLFVDDDPTFLEAVRQLFTALSVGAWEIVAAENHAQALRQLARERADVVVLDIGMPEMDGIEFLRLVRQTYPAQRVVMLTGHADEANRRLCEELGAALFLEKPLEPGGFKAIHDALEKLAGASAPSGPRGFRRYMGLPDVLQLECLGRKSSLIEVFTPQAQGRIYVAQGNIVHAEAGALEGEMALYGLLGLEAVEFNLHPFRPPPRRTISAHYEFLLMEAARLSDEGTRFFEATPAAAPFEPLPGLPLESGAAAEAAAVAAQPRPEEVILCSGAGEVLYEWQSPALKSRLALLAQLEQQAADLNGILPLGRFDRLEIRSETDRVVCQVQPHMRLFVRSARPAGGTP